MKRHWIAITLFVMTSTISSPLFARNAGIVVACSEKYAQDLYASLKIIRNIYQCDLPIEIWHAGDEMCQKTMEKLLSIDGVSLHDLVDIYGGEAEKYRGYHIKGFSLHASRFDECLLMDADVIFYQNPQVLLDHPEMKENAAYFFRDREDFAFQSYNRDKLVYTDRYFFSKFTYEERRSIFLHLVQICPDSIPIDWRHYWETAPYEFIKPTPSEHQDAGCIAIDKRRCPKGIELIKVLNECHDLFYQYILGDKETYWLSLAASNEPFKVNPTHPYRLRTNNEKREMLHLLDGEFFFMQKDPIDIQNQHVKLVPTGKLSPKRSLTKNELKKLNDIFIVFNHYTNEFYRST